MSRLARHMKVCAVLALLVGLAIAYAQAGKVDWDEMPRDVRSAKRRFDKSLESAYGDYTKAVARAEAERAEGMSEAEHAFVRVLDAEIKIALRKEDLELAMALREVKEQVESASGEEKQDLKKLLIGTWGRSSDSNWNVIFDTKGGVVEASGGDTNTGRWRVTDTHVLIIWNKTMGSTSRRTRIGSPLFWTAMRLPLDPKGTVIDGWRGIADTTWVKKATGE